MTELSAAESKFFESRGTDVDASLTTSEPAPSEPSPAPASVPASQPAAPAPAAPPATAPAAAPPDPNQTPQGFVRQEALHAERQRRQAMEQEFRQLQQQFQQVQQYLQQVSQPQDERPDPQVDALGAIEWDNRQLRSQIQQLSEWRTQQEQGQQRQTQVQRLTQHLTQSEQQFAQTTPDYFQAADYAIKREDLRLQAFYPDPAVRANILRQEIANVVAQSIQSGVNPAQLIYQHAANLGYTRAAAPAPAPGAAPAAPPAAPQTVPEVVSTIQRGLQQQSKGSGGSTPPSEMTPEMLLAMNGEEFQKNWDKAFKKR